MEKIVEYHSAEWEKLSFQNQVTHWGTFGWITWEVFECYGKKLALMKWSKF